MRCLLPNGADEKEQANEVGKIITYPVDAKEMKAAMAVPFDKEMGALKWDAPNAAVALICNGNGVAYSGSTLTGEVTVKNGGTVVRPPSLFLKDNLCYFDPGYGPVREAMPKDIELMEHLARQQPSTREDMLRQLREDFIPGFFKLQKLSFEKDPIDVKHLNDTIKIKTLKDLEWDYSNSLLQKKNSKSKSKSSTRFF